MLGICQNNKKIKHLHERNLLHIQDNKLSSYEEFLGKYGPVSLHQRNMQSRAIKMFQIKHGQSNKIVADIFFTDNKGVQFQINSRFWENFCKHSVSCF